jgi:hypothetical protein
MNDVTLVSMFYDIGREEWELYPRKVQDYLTAFESFLRYDYKMILFVDDRYISALYDKCVGSNVKLIPINERWLHDNLWSWSRLEQEKQIMNSDSYQSIVYDRIAKSYPENINPYYTILTHSKIDVINYVIDQHLSDDSILAWVDFGYFYNKTTSEFLPTGKLDLTKVDIDRVNICLINPIDDQDRDVFYTLRVAPEKIGAYFFLANRKNFKTFQQLCHKWLIKFQDEFNIADDEQAIWLQCYFDNPDLFKLHIFHAWHQALKRFSI